MRTTSHQEQAAPGASEEGASHGGHGGAAPGDLNRLAASATTHCLTGCVIGEVVGMFIATALGWGIAASIALAVGLAYVFGFALTSRPLFKAGLTLSAIAPIALAADTVSITIMEVIDNAIVLLVTGAEAEMEDPLLWISIFGGFAVAWPIAFLVNKAMISRGKGHAVVHEYHH